MAWINWKNRIKVPCLFAFWYLVYSARIRDLRWEPKEQTLSIPGISKIWTVTVDQVLTVLFSVDGADDTDYLSTYDYSEPVRQSTTNNVYMKYLHNWV